MRALLELTVQRLDYEAVRPLREAGLEPAASVAYLVKPASTTATGDALRTVFCD